MTIEEKWFWRQDDNGGIYSQLEALWMDGYRAGKNEAEGEERTARRDDVAFALDEIKKLIQRES